MFASDEQARAIEGVGRGLTWEWVDRPTDGAVPDWARGVRVEWMEGYANPPHYTVLTRSDPTDWTKVFRREGSRYLAESGDGRAACYYHSGEPQLTKLTRRLHSLVRCTPAGDGAAARKLPRDPWRYSRGTYHWDEVYEAWATPQQEGFAGSTFWVDLDDGRRVALRGPWHGPSPRGYLDVAAEWPSERGGTKWPHRLGITISEDALVQLLALYQAHMPVARVSNGRRTWVEAVRPDWDRPKSVRLAEGRL